MTPLRLAACFTSPCDSPLARLLESEPSMVHDSLAWSWSEPAEGAKAGMVAPRPDARPSQALPRDTKDDAWGTDEFNDVFAFAMQDIFPSPLCASDQEPIITKNRRHNIIAVRRPSHLGSLSRLFTRGPCHRLPAASTSDPQAATRATPRAEGVP
eukprot:jgi/Tetstr1/461445/TSEL_006554.t1